MKTWVVNNNKRKGDLAACPLMKGGFGLNSERCTFPKLKSWLSGFCEFLPVSDEDQQWQIVHVLKTEEEFGIAKSPVFILESKPTDGPYIIEDDSQSGFLSYCNELGIRGIEFNLVWCDDTSFLWSKLSEFLQITAVRLKRIMRTETPVAVNIECLNSPQIQLWEFASKASTEDDLVGKEEWLCSYLPNALESVKMMEGSKTGDLAIYGQSV